MAEINNPYGECEVNISESIEGNRDFGIVTVQDSHKFYTFGDPDGQARKNLKPEVEDFY